MPPWSLPRAEPNAVGYRLDTEHDVALLTFIRRARTLGLHVDGIRRVLAVRDGGTQPCAAVRDLLDAWIAETDAAVADAGTQSLTFSSARWMSGRWPRVRSPGA
ncbi:MerR family DNA-binding protein [Streptomyces sp. NPDC002888]|uniref:MerR family DNA-binding protein n=1 Tax=Streptomyces sp. NPDC002888 TaxID=3364668 RepID=UPI00368E73B3